MNIYDKYTRKQIELLNLQNIASFIFIITILISIYLTNLDKNNIIFNKNTKKFDLALLNRIIVTILSLTYLYINIYNTYIAKQRNKDLKNYFVELYVSIIVLIASLILLYLAYINKINNDFNISDIENPIL